MLSLQPMILAAALTVTGDVELLEFTATWCGPCQAMKGTVEQIKSMGYPVRTLDFDQRQDLAQRFGVTQVPTYIVMSNGQPVDRIVGAVPAGQLLGMMKRHTNSARPPSSTITRETAQPASRAAATTRQRDRMPFERTAMQATVRLRVDDAAGHSYGTGTIVDVHRDGGSIDALVLTCGHIFRDSKGQGEISVDLFGTPKREVVRGVLIRYDLDRDLALVGIKLRAPIKPIRVAGSSFQVQTGQGVFSIGCNHGKDPTVMRGRITQVNKFLGPENLTVSGRPVDGRSGGGLFSTDGYLIGVCNAADPQSDEGLYAAYRSIHKKLDQSQLSFVYQSRPRIDAAARTSVQPAGFQQGQVPARMPGQTDELPAVASAAAPANIESGFEPAVVGQTAGDSRAEVICIIRSPGQPDQDRLIVLDRPSREFMTRLQREDLDHQNRKLTELRVNRRIEHRAVPSR